MQFSLEAFIANFPTLKDHFQGSQKRYNSEIQIALYSDLSQTEQILPNHQIKDDEGNPILLFLATTYQFTQALFKKIYLLLIKNYNSFISSTPPARKISIIVVNDDNQEDIYAKLLKVLKFVPLGFLKMIKQIVVVKGIKGSKKGGQDPLQNYINGITIYIDNIHGLDPLGLWSAFNCIRPSLKQKDLPTSLSEKATDNRQNYFKAASLKSTVSFDLNELMGSNKQPKHHDRIDSYQLTDFYVPNVLVLLTCLLQTKQEYLKVQGLFRKSANIDDEKQALQALDSQNYFVLQNLTDPHIIANLIKKFFHRLDQPLFSFELYDVIADQEFSGEGGFYLQVATINKLQLPNYMTLKYIIWFFKQCLLPFQTYNRMSPQNLAIVFSPTFIRSMKPSVADLMNVQKLVWFVKELIVSSDKLFKIVDKIKQIGDIFPTENSSGQREENVQYQQMDERIKQSEILISNYSKSNSRSEHNEGQYIDTNDENLEVPSQLQNQPKNNTNQQVEMEKKQQDQKNQSNNLFPLQQKELIQHQQQKQQQARDTKLEQAVNEQQQVSQKQMEYIQQYTDPNNQLNHPKQQQNNLNLQYQQQKQQQQQDKTIVLRCQQDQTPKCNIPFDQDKTKQKQEKEGHSVNNLREQLIRNQKQNSDEFQVIQLPDNIVKQ